MIEKTTLREWIRRFDAGEFETNDVNKHIDAGWYDWFCKDSSLPAKTRKLGLKVKRIARSSKIDQDKVYVFFKNNCPVDGSLYDDFRICDLETGDVVYTIVPRCGHSSTKGRAEVWGRENDFDGPIVAGTWNDVLSFFGVL